MRFLLLLLLPIYLNAVNSITISGNPSAMSITTAVAGSAPTSVQNTATTYGVTTTASAKIIGKISSNTPTGVTLSVQLQAPTGATSAGLVSMTTTNKNLVTAIPTGISMTGLQITYQLSATSRAAPASNVSRTLTLTVQ